MSQGLSRGTGITSWDPVNQLNDLLHKCYFYCVTYCIRSLHVVVLLFKKKKKTPLTCCLDFGPENFSLKPLSHILEILSVHVFH